MKEFLWVEKYRPKSIKDTVLPESTKKIFQNFVDSGNIPNLLLAGKQGIGKTTVALAMLEEMGCDSIIINCSLDRNIDILRNEILQFASAMSLQGGRKYVILDEFDYANPLSLQPALRNFIEEFSKNCGFILTCNYKSKIIEPLHSRCSVVDFTISKDEMPKLAAQIFKRVCYILTEEEVEFDKKVVAEFVKKYFPDNRRVINELQFYAKSGKIDTGLLTASFEDTSMKALMGFIKEKNFTEVRKWVAQNSSNDPSTIFRKLYDTASEYFDGNVIPHLVLIIADYQHRAAFVADQEINMVACFTEIMANCL